MPSMGFYYCPKCKTVYRPLDAGQRHLMCCGVMLERIEGRGIAPTTPKSTAPVAPLTTSSAAREISGTNEVLEIIPPRENTVDALGVGSMLGRVAAETSFSLEIAGDASVRRLIVRGPHETLVQVRRQIQVTYDQAQFRIIPPEQDPARANGRARFTAEFTLHRPAYHPLRTFQDGEFLEADPVRGLLGAFANLEPGEHMLAQLILAPAPPHWADRFQAPVSSRERSMAGSPRSPALLMFQAVGLVISIVLLCATLWAIVAGLQHKYVEFAVAGLLVTAALAGVLFAIKLQNDLVRIDPKMLERKLDTSGFYDAALRVVAFAPTTDQARTRVRQLTKTYCQYNLAAGNTLAPRAAEFDPCDITLPRWSLWQEWLAQGMRLNTAEIASLWHLPVGVETPFVERAQSKRLLPLPNTVAQGILIGHSVHQGERIPVHLDPEILSHHIFMAAKTQKGKSTLMAHLALEATRRDMALVVIDPHGDLVRSMLGVIPPSRAGDVVYLDFSEPRQVVGLNLFDMGAGRSAHTIISNLIHVGQLVWKDYWGPRMEDCLREATRTLLCANEILRQRGQPQFTILDIPAIFQFNQFRRRLLEQLATQKDIRDWWATYYERLYPSLQTDVVNPVMTKVRRFESHDSVRQVVGQSTSTVNFRDLLKERRILLVNLASGVIGLDAAALLGAVLVDYINFELRAQMAIPDPSQRARALIVMDEFQTLSGVDYNELLAELQKMGGSFVLATQALGQLDQINPALRKSILANIATLFVFQTSAEDGDLLRHELDNAVTETDVSNLDDYACYVKTQLGHTRLPVMYVETLPPLMTDPAVIAHITGHIPRYTRPAALADSGRDAFQEQWYGRERNMLHNLMLTGRLQHGPSKRPAPDDKATSENSSTPLKEERGPSERDQHSHDTDPHFQANAEEHPAAAAPDALEQARDPEGEAGSRPKDSEGESDESTILNP